MCFGRDSCAYLDWQLTRCGPAAYDIAYFLGGALAAQTSESQVRALLRDYHQALGVDHYPFDDLWRDYQRALMLTVSSLAPTPDIEIDQGRGQEMMSAWLERLTARLQHVELATLV